MHPTDGIYVVIIILTLDFDKLKLLNKYVQKILSNFTGIEGIVVIVILCSFLSVNYIYVLSHYSTYVLLIF